MGRMEYMPKLSYQGYSRRDPRLHLTLRRDLALVPHLGFALFAVHLGEL